MRNFKINILYRFHKGPWGGGNQFLKALKNQMIMKGCYEKNPKLAQCILFNAHHNYENVINLKLKYQKKIFIHRIDGPEILSRSYAFKLDRLIYELNYLLADGTVFQSKWSKENNFLNGWRKTPYITVINNAPDKKIFYPLNNKTQKDRKNENCALIAISWAITKNKNFELYRYLDENLNFNEYSMKFVGNTPIIFKNIEQIKPVSSLKLANLIRESDIYISGGLNECCSNSLLEALNCGLPSVVINSGSNKEILNNGGELFNTFEECLEKIKLVRDNYKKYKNNIKLQDIEKISEKYINFIEKIYTDVLNNHYRVKNLSIIKLIKFRLKTSFRDEINQQIIKRPLLKKTKFILRKINIRNYKKKFF